MAGPGNSTADGTCFRFFTPEQVDQILRDGVRRGRAGTHAAIERVLKHETGIQRAQLWTRIRQLRHPPRELPYRHATWSEDDDRLLHEGYEKGWAGKQGAIRELLRRHPDWRPHVIWKRAAKLGLVQKRLKRGQERSRQPWSEHDDQILLKYTGYREVRVISKMLHRSIDAVRDRLRILGKSRRVHHEAYSRRALAKELHLSARTIQRLIIQGLLEVRDPRITRKSLDALLLSGRLPSLPGNDGSEAAAPSPGSEDPGEKAPCGKAFRPGSSGKPVAPAKSSRSKRAWAEAASTLNLSLEVIEQLIAKGTLKMYDPTITEKSLVKFCRRYGALINYDSLSRDTRDWLESTMDFVRDAGKEFAQSSDRASKHARIVRRCEKCNREIRGNAYFRHVKECRAPTAEADRIESPAI